MENQDLKDFRKRIDANIKEAQAHWLKIREEASGDFDKDYQAARACEMVVTNLIEAKMWVGKMLEANGAPFPAEHRDEADTLNNPNAETPVNEDGEENQPEPADNTATDTEVVDEAKAAAEANQASTAEAATTGQVGQMA